MDENPIQVVRMERRRKRGLGRQRERCFSRKMSLTVDVTPYQKYLDSGNLSLDRVAARSISSIINLTKRHANWPEEEAEQEAALACYNGIHKVYAKI